MPGVRFLADAHDLHPLAKRVLLVERDYSARSPVAEAMTLGQADYHITPGRAKSPGRGSMSLGIRRRQNVGEWC